jgi:hypothetical protein
MEIEKPVFGRDHYYEEVEGEPFIVDGFEEFRFFSRKEYAGLIISEVTTGMQVGDWYLGEISAKEDIRKRIETTGIEIVRKMIAENQIPPINK